MIDQSLQRLDFLCKTIPSLLYQIKESDFSAKPIAEKWSKKEILGHLIDSATNNHQRFVRAQFEDIPFIIYDQNNWNQYNYYQLLNTNQLISFWTLYNQHLCFLIKNISKENLAKECKTNNNKIYTLEFLIHDYVSHLEYHLKQIVDY